jgi:hypothetical protein
MTFIRKGDKIMTYKKVEINVYEEKPVFAGACGDFSSSCGASVHKKGATGACGDYSSSCYAQVHKNSGNAGCGDFSSSCGAKAHKK